MFEVHLQANYMRHVVCMFRVDVTFVGGVLTQGLATQCWLTWNYVAQVGIELALILLSHSPEC